MGMHDTTYARVQLVVKYFAAKPYLLTVRRRKQIIEEVTAIFEQLSKDSGEEMPSKRQIWRYIKDARAYWYARNDQELSEVRSKTLMQLDTIVEGAIAGKKWQSGVAAIKERNIVEGLHIEEINMRTKSKSKIDLTGLSKEDLIELARSKSRGHADNSK